jgi:hypothetical protein
MIGGSGLFGTRLTMKFLSGQPGRAGSVVRRTFTDQRAVDVREMPPLLLPMVSFGVERLSLELSVRLVCDHVKMLFHL